MSIIDSGLIPDRIIRFGIRRLNASRLRDEAQRDQKLAGEHHAAHLAALRRSPIAVHSDEANEQHYEVPAEFYARVLGPAFKYSAAYWPEGVTNLAAAEEAALNQVCERADVRDGQRVLDLGCGWGSFSLHAAARFPDASFLAISNSHGQRRFIENQIEARGLSNLEVRTQNVIDFTPGERFDRVVSVEMLEHLRNYGELFERIDGWLKPDGLLFVHIFTHATFGYLFEDEGSSDWMARHFFTGGQMPARDTLSAFDEHLENVHRWDLSGEHYEKTAEAWLRNLDDNREALVRILGDEFGHGKAAVHLNRWRVFFMACAELFGYRGGSEWGVTHYLFRSKRATGEPIAVAS